MALLLESHPQVVHGFFERTRRWHNVWAILMFALSFVVIFNKAIGTYVTAQWKALPAWYGLVGLGIVFLAGFLKVNYEQSVEKDRRIEKLEQRLAPRLEIVFDVQLYPSCMMESATDPRLWNDVITRLFRVEVRNAGGEAVDQVRLQLTSFDPQGARFLPVEMRFMHDRTPDGQQSRDGMTLLPGEIRLVDIVQKSQAPSRPEMELQYALQSLPSSIPTWVRPDPSSSRQRRSTM